MLWSKILVPVDFSHSTETILKWVNKFSGMGLMEVILLNVVNAKESSDREKKEINILLEDLASRIENKVVNIKILIRTGIPSLEIIKLSKEEDVKLIIIGPHGKGIFKQMIVGSTTFNVVRMSNIPVLIAKEQWYPDNDTKDLIERILFPIDFSDCSRYIIDQIKESKKYIRQIDLLAVAEKGETKEQVEELKIKYRKILDDIIRELKEENIKAGYIIEEGIASKNIIRIAQQIESNLIIMGKTGESFIQALLLGSTSEAVMRNSKNPILFIPCPI